MRSSSSSPQNLWPSRPLKSKLPVHRARKYGNKVLKRTVGETEHEYEPTILEEKQDRRNEMKARGTLLMALPNKDQLKFHSYKDAKLLMEAIEKRYGGNKESKKVQRTLLKQQYENFAGLSSETMDQTFDRLQKLISQLEIQGEVITQEDMNLKLLRNNTAYRVSAAHTQSNPASGDNLSDVVICAFLASQPNSPQLAQEDLEQIDLDDLEEMDLQWEMAFFGTAICGYMAPSLEGVASPHNQVGSSPEGNGTLPFTHAGGNPYRPRQDSNMRPCLGGKLDVNGQRVGFDRYKVECYNCHKYGHFERECRAPRNQENKGRKNNRRTVTVETPIENTYLVVKMELNGYNPPPEKYFLIESSGSSYQYQILSNGDAVEPKTVRKNSFRPPVIEDWNSDDDSEVEFIANVKDKTVRPSTEKIKFVRETIEKHKGKDSDNIIRTQTTTMPNVDIPQGMDTGDSPRRQETIMGALAQTRYERVLDKPNEPPLSEGHTSGSGEGRMEHTFELMDTVLDLEKEKDAQAVEILKLKQRVKNLERKSKSSISYPRRRIYRQVKSFDDHLDEEDASKQGRTSDKRQS
ncbi:ribonuclease H-like domain-containing protein [Tanacetum coccineum]|uniref:Ribonuclease H-like domain-containing protein n=1 Tax=Tanacetum coccineum TaxID=301880 RepID=A0ABQ5DQ92_9ASTR